MQVNAAMTLQQMAAAALERADDLVVLQYEDLWHTWGEIKALVRRIDALIKQSGAASDTAVTFIPRNHPAAVAALLGLIADGRTIRMSYAFQSAAGIARDVNAMRSGLVVADARDFSDEVKQAMAAHGMAAIAFNGMHANLIAGFERVDVARTEPSSEPQIQILTSGTTGAPKRFPVTQDMIARHHVAPRLAPDRLAEIAQEPPALLFFPLGNISGIYSSLPTLLRGQRAILVERFSFDAWLNHVTCYRPVMGGGPPALVQMILDANVPKERLASMRFFSTGAAPLDPNVQRAFEERYGIPILLSYGATEFGGPVCGMTPDLYRDWGARKFGTVGRVFAGAQIRVVDPETDEILPPGREGLLDVISQRLEPKWIRTSDLGMIDEDGFLFLRGRADGAIMRGGFKLVPEVIEHALLLHPSVSAASVVGIPDHRLGQVPAAAIQLKPDVIAPSIDELETHLRQNVLATHIPTQWRFVDTLPRTLSMKVDRPAVTRLFTSA